MYKLIVNVSGKHARIVPSAHRLITSERQLGDALSAQDALNNRDSLEDAVRGILTQNGIKDAEMFTIGLPDILNPAKDAEIAATEATRDEQAISNAKGPITKPLNPKEGELNSETNKPEDLKGQDKDLKPKEQEAPPSAEDIKKGETDESKKQA